MTWTEPVVTDNSGLTPDLQSNYNSGETFGVGSPVVTVSYTATDEAGNAAVASFTISVIVGQYVLAYDRHSE